MNRLQVLSSATLAAMLAMVATPSQAEDGEVVDFAYTRSELANAATRLALLERMTDEAAASCRVGFASATASARQRCTESLVRQFVRAIDDEALSDLAARGRSNYRSARR